MTRRAALLVALVAAGAALLSAAGRADAEAEGARPLVVAAAGESLGNLEPCHCVQGMLGGMPRRLSALARERLRADVVALDGGDLTGRDLHPRLLEAKTRAALELLARAEVAAVAVGEKDLRLGHAALGRVAAGAGVTLLGANLTLADGRRPFAASRRLRAGGRTVVVVGVLDPELGGDPTGQLDVGDPDAAARAALEGAPPGALRVLLFHGARARAREALGEDLPVDVIVCGHEQETWRPLERHGRAWLVETVRDARALARLAVPAEGPPDLEHVALDGQVPDDDWARRRVERYYQEVAGLPEPPRRPTPDGGSFVGSETCRGCHPGAWEVFEGTGHHGAYRHVMEKDPARAGLFECVGCHVVGHGFEGGFRSLADTPHLAEVGCESCHGVGSNHALGPPAAKRGYGVRPGFPESWRATCLGCHDATNSPGFDFERALERIKHWSDR
ncbi:MAG: cytochrome c family protein [Planctomycetes bacterium]|nr:cytochrome c family protein [Planctomycetota bacterium]